MNEPSELRPTNVRMLALGLLAVTSASAYLARYCISVSSTVIEHDLGFQHKQMSWVFAAFMVGYLIGQIPGGGLGNRIGTRASLALIIAAWSACTAWSAYSRSLAPLVASQFAVGLAQAGLVPITSIAVKDWFPASRRGFPSAIVTSAMSAGGVVAMWLTGKLVTAWHDDWSRIFLFYSSLGIGWSMVFFLLFRTRPAEHPWINTAEVELIAADETPPPTQPIDAGQQPAPAGRGALLRMATSLSVWALGWQWFFRSAGYQFFARWFPAFLQERYGMTVDQSGSYSSWPLLGVAVGAFAGGFLVDSSLKRTGSRWVSRNLTSLVTLVLCAACLVCSEFFRSGEGFAALMALGAVFAGISMPAGWAANIDIGGKETPLLFAVMNMAATAAGIVAPTCVGYLMTHIGNSGGDYGLVVYLHVAIYLATAACWLFVNPNRSLDSQDAGDVLT